MKNLGHHLIRTPQSLHSFIFSPASLSLQGDHQGMSPDIVKEIARTGDSLVSQCKKDIADLHDPVSPRGRLDDEACLSGAEEQLHCCDRVGTSSEMQKDKFIHARYFIIKSLNHDNIQLSVKKGIWATQVMNEPILEEAFQNSGKVILIFSVNMSGFFQGYAQMMSSVGWRRDNIWSQGTGKNNPWGRSFKIKWLCLSDLPFQKTLHLKNPWNDYKPVKISRDCQELPPDVGEALCQLLDGGDYMGSSLERVELSGNDFPSKGPYVNPFHSVPNEEFNVPPVHMAPLMYPFYQHQTQVSRFNLPHPEAGAMPNKSSVVPGISIVKQSKHQITGSSACRKTNSSLSDSSGSAESCLLNGTLTEDDILEMTYEEYLEAHRQCSRRLLHSAAGQSMSLLKSTSSKERSDDSQSASSSKKRTHCSSLE